MAAHTLTILREVRLKQLHTGKPMPHFGHALDFAPGMGSISMSEYAELHDFDGKLIPDAVLASLCEKYEWQAYFKCYEEICNAVEKGMPLSPTLEQAKEYRAILAAGD